jgi:hypothetical protein
MKEYDLRPKKLSFRGMNCGNFDENKKICK